MSREAVLTPQLTAQVDVLYQTAPGTSTVSGRLSIRDPSASLMEGWAGWVAADTDGEQVVLSTDCNGLKNSCRAQLAPYVICRTAVNPALTWWMAACCIKDNPEHGLVSCSFIAQQSLTAWARALRCAALCV